MAKHGNEEWLCERRGGEERDWSGRRYGAEHGERAQTRERSLTRHGLRSLSDAELLEVLLPPDSDPAHDLQDFRQVLARAGGLCKLFRIEGPLLECMGLARGSALKLETVREIRRRLTEYEIEEALSLDQTTAIARLLTERCEHERQEVLGVLFLDARRCLIALREIFRGTRDRIAADNGVILREALLLAASNLVLFHNHPTGDPTPSSEDLHFTRQLAEAATLLNIRLLDHIVLGSGGRWRSLRERLSL